MRPGARLPPLPRRVDVAVIGGGISGLSAAHRVKELSEAAGTRGSLVLLEADERLGGMVRTDRIEGALIEAGPDSMVTHKPEGVALCHRIGLGDELIYPEPRRTATHVVHDGQLHAIPDGFALIVPSRLGPLLRSGLFSWSGKLRMLAEPLIPARRAAGDESLRSFVTRRFGREAFERVAEPVLGGLFTADTDHLSARMTVPRFLDDEARHGSLLRGALRARRRRGPAAPAPGPSFVALRGGLESLPRRLAALLPPGTVRTGTPVSRLERDGALWRLSTPDGEVTAAAVILACPAYAAARMLAGLDAELAAHLSGLHYASCAIVNLVYRRTDLARPLDSFGFFVPRTAGLPILACSHVSEKFGGRVAPDRVLLRVFLGGAVRPEVLERGDADLARLSHDALRDLLAIRGEPLLLTIRRHPRSMPQHPAGDQVRVDRVVTRAATHPGLELCGSLVGAIGLPDCIRTGEAAARSTVTALSARQEQARAGAELARP